MLSRLYHVGRVNVALPTTGSAHGTLHKLIGPFLVSRTCRCLVHWTRWRRRCYTQQEQRVIAWKTQTAQHSGVKAVPWTACWCMGQPWGGASTEASALAAGAAAEEEEAAPILTWEMVKHLTVNHFRGSTRHCRLSMRGKRFVEFRPRTEGPSQQLLSGIF